MNEQLKHIVDGLMANLPAADGEGKLDEPEAESVVREVFRHDFNLEEFGSVSFIGKYRTYRPPCGDVWAQVWMLVTPGGSGSCSQQTEELLMWSGPFHTDVEAEEALSVAHRRIEDHLARFAFGLVTEIES